MIRYDADNTNISNVLQYFRFVNPPVIHLLCEQFIQKPVQYSNDTLLETITRLSVAK